MTAATKKIIYQRKKGKGVEGDIKQSEEGLVITEAAAKAVLQIYPLLEKVGTKIVEHKNVCKIFKENNMDYSQIVLPCMVNNCRSGESLSFYIYYITSTPFHHSPLHNFTHLEYYHIRSY